MNSGLSPHKSTFNAISSILDLETSVSTAKTKERQSDKKITAPSSIVVDSGKLRISIAIENILFAKAEHVYVSIYFFNEQRLLQRGTLSGLLGQLPKEQFIQVHRSYIVNLSCVESWTNTHVVVKGKEEVPISRSRRATVLARLENR